MQQTGKRRSSYREPRANRGAVFLFVGALVLLLISGALIVAMLRQGAPTKASTPAPTGTVIAAASEPPPTAIPAAIATAVPATATGTVRPPTVAASVRPATAVPIARPATPPPLMVSAGGCAMALPAGFAEEKPGGGYYPATDRTGFAALDPFETNGGQRSTADVTQAFIEGTLKLALQDYRQTALVRTDDGSRIDYTARAGQKNGRGVVVVRRIGDLACGVTLFALSDSPLAFDQTLAYLLSSLQPTRP